MRHYFTNQKKNKCKQFGALLNSVVVVNPVHVVPHWAVRAAPSGRKVFLFIHWAPDLLDETMSSMYKD